MKQRLKRYLVIEPYRVSHAERLISAAGAFLGILLILYCSQLFLSGISAYLIVASMGASAVLLFAVPHGRLAQPWALLGGHFVSALVGVSCAKLIPDIYIASAAAVGIAVGVMYYLHCIHPPGGATALTAVVGGEQVIELGYQYVITPVMLNTLAILIVAVSFNYLFNWRRYPAYLAEKKTPQDTKVDSPYDAITHEDFVYALSEIDSLIDVSESDLLRIYDLVTQRHVDAGEGYKDLVPGKYYSNGAYGDAWAVRQIIDWDYENNTGINLPEEEQLIYKVVAGNNRRNTGVMTKKEFARWARHEVIRDEENWRRVGLDDSGNV